MSKTFGSVGQYIDQTLSLLATLEKYVAVLFPLRLSQFKAS